MNLLDQIDAIALRRARCATSIPVPLKSHFSTFAGLPKELDYLTKGQPIKYNGSSSTELRTLLVSLPRFPPPAPL
jgi:hypothetical protein